MVLPSARYHLLRAYLPWKLFSHNAHFRLGVDAKIILGSLMGNLSTSWLIVWPSPSLVINICRFKEEITSVGRFSLFFKVINFDSHRTFKVLIINKRRKGLDNL